MMRPATQVLRPASWPLMRQVAIVIGGSIFMGLCGRLSLPLPFTPVPLSLANFGVILLGLTLGSRRAFAALVLYLAEGTMGMPVFSPAGPGGVAQLLGPTGGYLMAYPLAAFLAGCIAEHGRRQVVRRSIAALGANVVIFAGGISWLMVVTHAPLAGAAYFGLYPFVFGEIVKLMAAVAIAGRLDRFPRFANLLH